MIPPSTCSKCGKLNTGDLLSVRERVPSTATRYSMLVQWWCKDCRKENHGAYKRTYEERYEQPTD